MSVVEKLDVGSAIRQRRGWREMGKLESLKAEAAELDKGR